MRKLICICVSLILILACGVSAFAELFIYSPEGNILDADSGESTRIVQLDSSCYYDRINKMYVYSTGVAQEAKVESSVYSGMAVTDEVKINAGPASTVEIYVNGEVQPLQEPTTFSAPGSYTIRNTATDREVLSFTILAPKTGAITSYKIPSIFFITAANYEGENLPTSFDTVPFDKDGLYSIKYKSSTINVEYALVLEIDHTYPELEIFGVEEGIADGPVSFGELERGASLFITKDGEAYTMYGEELKEAGEYVVKYIDDAGNVSSYYFTIHIFFDGGAWVFIGLAAAIIIAAVVYMIRCRKHMRVR